MVWVQNSLIDEIKSNVKVSDLLVTRYNKRVDCPACNRVKTASIINNERVYCYAASCGLNVDVIGLNSVLQWGTKDKYKESIKDLANKFNIKCKSNLDLPRYNFYREVNNTFIGELEGAPLQYLLNRGLTLDVIKTIGVGYASGTTLRGTFSRHDLIQYGLFKNNKEFFINRVIFPLISNNSYITSFVGRYIGPSNDLIPKYKNLEVSIHTLILEQFIDLYNTNNMLCIAEGFMDTISLYSMGLQAVGILGVQGLLNYTNKLAPFKCICFCFDSDKDEEGNYKSYKALIHQIIDLILINPTTKYYIYLPDKAKDINDLLTKNLISKQQVEDNKVPFIDFLMNLYIEDNSKHTSLIKLIQVTNDEKNREVFYNLIGKTSYNYVLSILNF
jgi:DNA primase